MFLVKYVDVYDLFLTFKNAYSRCRYIYPIKEWSKVLDKFKIFRAEVENQHDDKGSVIWLGGVYDGRHTQYSQVLGPFVRFLRKWHSHLVFYVG
jgi:hypothetical protein